VLSATRHRVRPASLLVTCALVPAGASAVATTSVTSSVSTGSAVSASRRPAALVRTAARPTSTHLAAAARAARIRSSAVLVARTRLGSRYVAGAAGPRRFDCSGLTLYVVKKATGRSLPHYSKAQYSATKRVARKDLRRGDLVFFFGLGAHHVGIYIGGGRMIGATNPRQGVRIDSVFSGWYGKRYSGAGRLV
jgi:cell wall-associated NlpC family hydrolase